MASPLLGVWELISDDEKALLIFTEKHLGGIFQRTQGRRGFIASYTVMGNRFHATALADSSPTAPPEGNLEFQVEDNVMTWKFVTRGEISPSGHVDKFRKIADLTMTSPFAGVWQLVSETDKSLVIRTDTHWLTIRSSLQRGLAGTTSVTGSHVRDTVILHTALNSPVLLEFECHREGDTFTVKRMTESAVVPVGHTDQWRKIG